MSLSQRHEQNKHLFLLASCRTVLRVTWVLVSLAILVKAKWRFIFHQASSLVEISRVSLLNIKCDVLKKKRDNCFDKLLSFILQNLVGEVNLSLPSLLFFLPHLCLSVSFSFTHTHTHPSTIVSVIMICFVYCVYCRLPLQAPNSDQLLGNWEWNVANSGLLVSCIWTRLLCSISLWMSQIQIQPASNLHMSCWVLLHVSFNFQTHSIKIHTVPNT